MFTKLRFLLESLNNLTALLVVLLLNTTTPLLLKLLKLEQV